MFTHEEEMKCARPSYTECAGDVELVSLAYSRAEQIATEMRVSRGQIALIAFSNELFQSVRSFGSSHNKPIEVLDTRGDIEAVQRAERSGRFIVSTPEYVGGLEFSAVLLIGVDEGRVPPAKSTFSLDSSNFLNYAAHNRLYVSITRAKYRVDILASKERGISSLLKSAVANDLLEKKIC
jgi:superfamily I DNA/RNA helicase